MRRGMKGLLVLTVLVVAGVAGGAGAAPLSGSAKGTDGNITCGTSNQLVDVNGIGVYANTASDRTELEACNDTGAGNSQGRLIVRANHNTSQPGARATLDSDRDQTPSNICCGYINAQVGVQGTGVWCSEDGGSGDGYSRGWSSPGDDGGLSNNEPGDRPGPVECLPAEG